LNHNGEGDIIEVYHDGDTYSLEGFAEHDDFKTYNEFLDDYLDSEKDKYNIDIESDWVKWIDYYVNDTEILTFDLKQQQEANPSLFKSDVKNFINNNQHHLGERPHTYANTIWRMRKMEKLINILEKIK